MSIVLKRCGLATIAVMFLALSQPSFAALISYDFTSVEGNKGHVYDFDSTLTITAWGGIKPGDDAIAYFDGPTGSDCVDKDNKDLGSCENTVLSGTKKKDGTTDSPADEGVGLGVQEPAGENDLPLNGDSEFKGSTGISGKGREVNEQLVFEFSTAVLASSIVIGLTGIDFGTGLDDLDDLILYVDLIGGPEIYSSHADTSGACVDVGNGSGSPDYTCNLTFALLGGVDLTGISITRFALRGVAGEYRISSLSGDTSVPEPATLVLMSLGLLGLGFSRRKRFQ